jgi:hypothetical protein
VQILPLLVPVQLYLSTTSPNVQDNPVTSNPKTHVVRAQVAPLYIPYALMGLGMTLIRANTLAFGLIGKDGSHRIKKICFVNMNLVFGSEVALLGSWEYMFGILVTVN